MIALTDSSAFRSASAALIATGAASAPRSMTWQVMPALPAALVIDRTYQAVASSAVAVTTASTGGGAPGGRAEMPAVTDSRIRAPSSLPESTAAVIGRPFQGLQRSAADRRTADGSHWLLPDGHRAIACRTAAVIWSARAVISSTLATIPARSARRT